MSSVDSDGMNLLMLFVLKLKDFNDPRAYQYIKAFIQSGQVKVNHLTKRKQNVLHQIILKSVEVKSSLVNVIQILSFIISKGLNINQQDTRGRTALHYLFVPVNNQELASKQD